MRKVFGYDMCHHNRNAMVHIRGTDMKKWGGSEKLHRVMLYPCASAGRDIELKRY